MDGCAPVAGVDDDAGRLHSSALGAEAATGAADATRTEPLLRTLVLREGAGGAAATRTGGRDGVFGRGTGRARTGA
ncbi:MAG TPA: hypothetical protein VMV18_10670, partial [bacterium]|nr:hypothetical protein [bacterium]